MLIRNPRNLLSSFCLAAAVVIGPIGSAIAQQAGNDASGTVPLSPEHLAFDAADSNGDGVVSEAELARDAAAGFSSLDKDGSKTLTRNELAPHDPAAFSRVDANGDGVLTFREVMVNKTRALSESDKDRDGGLSFDEMVEAARAEQGVVQ